MNMKKLNKDEKGFTFIELLIAILLTGIIASAITGMILYVFNANFTTANRMAAVRQVRNVGFWVTPDIQMAKNVTTGGTSGFPLTLTWKEWDTTDSHEIIYSLADMSSGEFKVLKREHYIESVLDSTIIVAEYIDLDQTSIDPDQPCSFPDCGAYILTVTATVGGRSETREYEIQPRPGSQ
jgi:prepilin-type N-terminal cleavage/methylation domain-containing protein